MVHKMAYKMAHKMVHKMAYKIIYLIVLFALLIVPVATQAAPGEAVAMAWDDLPPEIQAKVDPRLLAEFRGEITPVHLGGDRVQVPSDSSRRPLEKTLFLVYLKAQPDLDAVSRRRFANAVAQREAVTDVMLTFTQRSQRSVRVLLEKRRSGGDVSAYYPYYIINGMAVEGDLDTMIELALRDDVERILANSPLVKLDGVDTQSAPRAATDLGGLAPENWNVDLVDAERVWNELGVDGTGAVVADFDSGVEWDHPALQNSYRGWDGTSVDHNYNWFAFNGTDPAYWDMNGNYGASVFPTPVACGDHGIHTMGTMVGNGGTATTRVGMAPGAKWIAVPGLCQPVVLPWGYESIIGAVRSFQWLMCPTDLSGDLSTRDCSKAPDVINNSWGSSDPADETFRPIIRALRAAGIVPVFASGNPEAGLGSIGSPASAPEAITVGATDINDQVASFSGRGPSFYDGVQKPNLAAPGVDILSAVSGGEYMVASGTSMAAPAVSGVVALMISADLQDGHRDLSVDEIAYFLEHTAVDLGPSGPDDEYGYGRIDAYQAVRWVLAAGDLAGNVTDAVTGAPVVGATLSGTHGADTFTSQTAAGGFYSTTVPAGVYQVDVTAFGYEPASFSGAIVVTGTQAVADFYLTPLPVAGLQGVVQSSASGVPISGAVISVDAAPALTATSGPDGAYALTLPEGTHDLTVKLKGYRIAHQSVTITAGGTAQDILLDSAPTILLVEGDAHYGWFINRPAMSFFKWSLDRRDYLYDEFAIYTDTLPVLSGYDVVIDIQTTNSPYVKGFNTALENYLNQGGHVIFSGQSVAEGAFDNDKFLLENYLHATLVNGQAAGLGDTVSGLDFLDGLNLTINDAALYNYPNSILSLHPDAVQPRDGASFPIMTYNNGSGAAALAIDPCDAPYRAVYFAVGYENLGPRAYSRPEAYADVLDRSIEWLMEEGRPDYRFNMHVLPEGKLWPAGSVYTYTLSVANSGGLADTFDFSLMGNSWPTAIYSGTTPANQTGLLAPCAVQTFQVPVAIPPSTPVLASDTFTVTAASQAQPALTFLDSARTTAFSDWQGHSNAGGQISSWMAAAAYQCTPYAIGGLSLDETVLQTVQAYDPHAGRWVQKAPKPTGAFGMQAGVIDGKFYVPGGYTNLEADDLHPTDRLEIYDPVADTWRSAANMPGPRGGASVAVSNGKLYVFGGASGQTGDDIYLAVWEYDPAADHWAIKGDMPYEMLFGGAAGLGDQIYVGGDFLGEASFYEYDPAGDTWTQKADFPDGGRKDPILVGVEGRVYLYSGDAGQGSSFYLSAYAYEPANDAWRPIADTLFGRSSTMLSVPSTGAGVFAGGKLWAFGSSLGSLHTESVTISDSFCASEKTVQQALIQPGERLTYTLSLHSDPASLDNVSVFDPLPAGTTFGGFGVVSVNPPPVFNAALNRVEWRGSLPGGQPPAEITFGAVVNPPGWHNGQVITNTAAFAAGPGLNFNHADTSQLNYFDLSASVKTVDKANATAGETLTYKIRLANAAQHSGAFSVSDVLPAGTSYLPGSLSATSGEANITAGTITWNGELPVLSTLYTNHGDTYAWGDSDGQGAVPGVTFAWQDMSGALQARANSYEQFFGPLPLDFDFTFFGQPYEQFYIARKGSMMFSPHYSLFLDCSVFGAGLPDDLIAGFGGDVRTYDSLEYPITYKVFGSAPHRYLVIEHLHIAYLDNLDNSLDVQIMLYEGSDNIVVQYANLTAPVTMLNGIDGRAPGYSSCLYQDHCQTGVHSGLAVRYVPPGSSYTQVLSNQAELTFAVQTSPSLPDETLLTNTTMITDSSQVVTTRSAETLIESPATDTPTPLATATNTRTPTPTQNVSVCQVDYTANQWSNGFTANVKITNNSTSAIQGWNLVWSFDNGQQITGAWNATVTQSGANVTAGNPAGHWNGTIGANGGSVSFGFQATHSGTNLTPDDFALNGNPCNGGGGPTNTPTPTATRTATRTNTPSGTPTRTPTRTSTGTITTTPTATATRTATRTNTPSGTPTRTPTSTQTGTITNTPTQTPTQTITRTRTPSGTPTRTNTPSATATRTSTRTPTPTQNVSVCQVDYTVNQWSNGFTANVKITNNSTSAIQGWNLAWSFDNGQQITGAWNATVTQRGANVTAGNPAGHWNGTIGANGGSVSFGFQATHSGTNLNPDDFALNGMLCLIGSTP